MSSRAIPPGDSSRWTARRRSTPRGSVPGPSATSAMPLHVRRHVGRERRASSPTTVASVPPQPRARRDSTGGLSCSRAHRRARLTGRAAPRPTRPATLPDHGPDPRPGPARAPGARSRVRPRRAPAARGRVRAGERARPARLGRRRSGAPRSRPGSTAARSRRRSAGRAGRSLEQVLVHEQFGQVDGRPVVVHPGRLQRRSSTPTPTSAGATSTRACAASARGATRSPRTAPAPTRGPCARPRSATRRPATTCSTARSGS